MVGSVTGTVSSVINSRKPLGLMSFGTGISAIGITKNYSSYLLV